MRADVATFISGAFLVSALFLVVTHGQATSNVIRETGGAGSAFFGTLITGNPAFADKAIG